MSKKLTPEDLGSIKKDGYVGAVIAGTLMLAFVSALASGHFTGSAPEQKAPVVDAAATPAP